MTREEALESYEKLYDYMVGDDDAVKLEYGEFMELSHYIRAALRGPTREMVERMRGEWQSIHGLSEYYCSRCKEKYQFCPHCMAPMTDKAVDIRLKELEALYDKDM